MIPRQPLSTTVPISLALIVGSLCGCSTPFDEAGNLPPERSSWRTSPYEPASQEHQRYIGQRSIQLWKPLALSESGAPDFAELGIAQGALISDDGYALTAAHFIDSRQVFTIQAKEEPRKCLRIKQWKKEGLISEPIDGQEEVVRNLKLGKVRLIHRFEQSDLALIHTTLRPLHYFNMATGTPNVGAKVSIGLNPVIHSDTAAISGPVSRVWTMGASSWRARSDGVAIEGDSGGAVLDQKLNLQGNLVGGRVRPWFRPKRVVDVEFEGISAKMVIATMEQDRRTGQEGQNVANYDRSFPVDDPTDEARMQNEARLPIDDSPPAKKYLNSHKNTAQAHSARNSKTES